MGAFIGVRVLAQDGRQVWVAVSGRLARTTAPVLAHALRLREAEGFASLFVDVTSLGDDRELAPGELWEAFPDGRRLAFHIIGPVEGLGSPPGRDPRFVFHPDTASAWRTWMGAPDQCAAVDLVP
ncbi:hypothetical protein AB0M39_25085 [Streptomyces sp. NPDC051907]|uniref:hypothetical protein n=1 Tax=Streptomyces sp. NPDC051907 TaxID=3155284 RepID=UPI0034401051